MHVSSSMGDTDAGESCAVNGDYVLINVLIISPLLDNFHTAVPSLPLPHSVKWMFAVLIKVSVHIRCSGPEKIWAFCIMLLLAVAIESVVH